MGKLLLAALFGGILASVLTFFLMTSLATGDRRAEVESRMSKAEASSESAGEKAEVASRRLELLQRRLETATREHAAAVGRIEASLAERTAASAGADGTTLPPPAAPDGTPYVSRAEMEAAIAKARSAGGISVQAKAEPVEMKSLEEIARDMNLSAAEEANARIILRQSEEEVVQCLFGDRPFSDIEAEVRAAKADPDKMESMISDTAMRAFSNMGKLLTVEARTRKKLGESLGKDRAKDLLSRPHKPVLGNDFENLFKGLDLE